MPKGIPKSGKRVYALRSPRITVACVTCGRPIVTTAARGQKFCARDCYVQWWVNNVAPKRKFVQFSLPLKRPAPKPRKCKLCQSEFQVNRIKSPQIFCSPSCAHKSRRKHKSEAERKQYAKAYMREYCINNRDRHRSRSRKWAVANRQKRLEIQRRYREKNRASITLLSQKRRANQQKGKAASPEQVADILKRTDGHCVYCGIRAKLTIDHFTPLSAGGNNQRSNLFPCCTSCNSSKNNREAIEWLTRKHGAHGLARTLMFIERRKIPEALWA